MEKMLKEQEKETKHERQVQAVVTSQVVERSVRHFDDDLQSDSEEPDNYSDDEEEASGDEGVESGEYDADEEEMEDESD